MKRIMSLALVIILMFSLSACEQKIESKEKEVTIAYFRVGGKFDEMGREKAYPYYLLNDICEEVTGLKVKINYIDVGNKQELMYKLSTEGKTGKLGDLVYLECDNYNEELNLDGMIQKLINTGAVEDIREELKNYDNILNLFKRTKYIPINMDLEAFPIHKEIVEEYNLTKEGLINQAQKLDIIKMLAEDRKIELSRKLFELELCYEPQDYYKFTDKNIEFDTEKFKAYVNRIDKRFKNSIYKSEIFEKEFKYIEENYMNWTYETYYIDLRSEADFISDSRVGCILTHLSPLVPSKSKFIVRMHDKENLGAYEPKEYKLKDMEIKIIEDGNLGSTGFMVLKSSKNKKAAIEFLDFMISDRGQMHILKSGILGNRNYKSAITSNLIELVDEAVSEANFIINDPTKHKEVTQEQREIMKETIEYLQSDELLNKMKELSDVNESTFKGMLEDELKEMKIRMIFDKEYNIEKMEEKIENLVHEINMKVYEMQ